MKRVKGIINSDVESIQNVINEAKRQKLVGTMENENSVSINSIVNDDLETSNYSNDILEKKSHLKNLNFPTAAIQTSTPIINASSSSSSPDANHNLAESLSSIHDSVNGTNSELDIVMNHDVVENNDINNKSNDIILNGNDLNGVQSHYNGTPPANKNLEIAPENSENMNISEENSSQENYVETTENLVDAILEDNWQDNIENMLSSLLNVTTLEGHSDIILSVAADEDIILSASRDTTIKLWNSATKKEEGNFSGHSDAVNSIQLLTKAQSLILAEKLNFTDAQNMKNIVISGSSDCSIRLWSVPTGKEMLSVYTFNGITCVGFFELQSYIIIGTDGGKLEMWDPSTSKLVHSVFAHENSVTGLKVEECYVYTASSDGMVKVWLIEENELQIMYTRRRKEISENKLTLCQWKSITSYKNIIYLGDNTSNIKILDWSEGKLRMLRNQLQQNGVTDAVHVKNSVLLSSSYDSETEKGAINVWLLPAMQYLCTMSGDVNRILSLAISEPKSNLLRIVSGGAKLLVWEFDLTKAPAKGSSDSYYCYEVEEVGEEFTAEKSIQHTVNPSEMSNSGIKKSSWCTLL